MHHGHLRIDYMAFTTMNLHDVVSIVVNQSHQIRDSRARTFTITHKDGSEFSFTVFAASEENITIKEIE